MNKSNSGQYSDATADLQDHQNLIDASKAWLEQLVVECNGKIAQLLGGHNASANSLYVWCKCGDDKAHADNQRTPIYAIEDWVFGHCKEDTTEFMVDEEIDGACMDLITLQQPGHPMHGKALREVCRATAEGLGGHLLAGSTCWVYWWDEECSGPATPGLVAHEQRGVARRMPMTAEVPPKGKATKGAAGSSRGKKSKGPPVRGAWYRAEVVAYDPDTGKLFIFYLADQERHQILLPLTLAHWGDDPPETPDTRSVVRMPPPALPPPSPDLSDLLLIDPGLFDVLGGDDWGTMPDSTPQQAPPGTSSLQQGGPAPHTLTPTPVTYQGATAAPPILHSPENKSLGAAVLGVGGEDELGNGSPFWDVPLGNSDLLMESDSALDLSTPSPMHVDVFPATAPCGQRPQHTQHTAAAGAAAMEPAAAPAPAPAPAHAAPSPAPPAPAAGSQAGVARAQVAAERVASQEARKDSSQAQRVQAAASKKEAEAGGVQQGEASEVKVKGKVGKKKRTLEALQPQQQQPQQQQQQQQPQPKQQGLRGDGGSQKAGSGQGRVEKAPKLTEGDSPRGSKPAASKVLAEAQARTPAQAQAGHQQQGQPQLQAGGQAAVQAAPGEKVGGSNVRRLVPPVHQAGDKAGRRQDIADREPRVQQQKQQRQKQVVLSAVKVAAAVEGAVGGASKTAGGAEVYDGGRGVGMELAINGASSGEVREQVGSIKDNLSTQEVVPETGQPLAPAAPRLGAATITITMTTQQHGTQPGEGRSARAQPVRPPPPTPAAPPSSATLPPPHRQPAATAAPPPPPPPPAPPSAAPESAIASVLKKTEAMISEAAASLKQSAARKSSGIGGKDSAGVGAGAAPVAPKVTSITRLPSLTSMTPAPTFPRPSSSQADSQGGGPDSGPYALPTQRAVTGSEGHPPPHHAQPAPVAQLVAPAPAQQEAVPALFTGLPPPPLQPPPSQPPLTGSVPAGSSPHNERPNHKEARMRCQQALESVCGASLAAMGSTVRAMTHMVATMWPQWGSVQVAVGCVQPALVSQLQLQAGKAGPSQSMLSVQQPQVSPSTSATSAENSDTTTPVLQVLPCSSLRLLPWVAPGSGSGGRDNQGGVQALLQALKEASEEAGSAPDSIDAHTGGASTAVGGSARVEFVAGEPIPCLSSWLMAANASHSLTRLSAVIMPPPSSPGATASSQQAGCVGLSALGTPRIGLDVTPFSSSSSTSATTISRGIQITLLNRAAAMQPRHSLPAPAPPGEHAFAVTGVKCGCMVVQVCASPSAGGRTFLRAELVRSCITGAPEAAEVSRVRHLIISASQAVASVSLMLSRCWDALVAGEVEGAGGIAQGVEPGAAQQQGQGAIAASDSLRQAATQLVRCMQAADALVQAAGAYRA